MRATRRRFLTAVAAGFALSVRGRAAEQEAEVGPAEDLMREHGVLRRVMFLYDEAAHRLDGGDDPPLDALAAAAAIVKRGIEDYHEKLEESFVFPRLEKAKKLTTLTATLRQQHAAGRNVTAEISRLSKATLAAGAAIVKRVIEDYHEKLEENFVFPRLEKAKKLTVLTATLRDQHVAGRKVTAEILRLSKSPLADADRGRLSHLLRSFNRMYRPHAAREDTVLFPAFHDLVGNKAWAEMGEQFEAEEKKKLGEQGFEGAVAQVAKLEEQFGMADLAQFTPR